MADRPKFKNASELTAYLEELYKDADMMEDDQRILRYERLGIEMIEKHKNPEWRAEWEEKNTLSNQLKAKDLAWLEKMKSIRESSEYQEKIKSIRESSEYQENRQAMLNSAKWQDNQKIGGQKRSQNKDWREKNKIALQNKSQDWQDNHKLAMQILSQSTEWREKNKLANQQRLSKQISCDGVIYESQKEAMLALAPETRLTDSSKKRWIQAQMIKFPDRYFYITQSE